MGCWRSPAYETHSNTGFRRPSGGVFTPPAQSARVVSAETVYWANQTTGNLLWTDTNQWRTATAPVPHAAPVNGDMISMSTQTYPFNLHKKEQAGAEVLPWLFGCWGVSSFR